MNGYKNNRELRRQLEREHHQTRFAKQVWYKHVPNPLGPRKRIRKNPMKGVCGFNTLRQPSHYLQPLQ